MPINKKSAPNIVQEDYSVPINQWEAPSAQGNPIDPFSSVTSKAPFEQVTPTITSSPVSANQTDRTIYIANPNINPDKSLAKYETSTSDASNDNSNQSQPNIKEMFEADKLLHFMEKLDINPDRILRKFIPEWISSLSDMGKLLLLISVNYDVFKEEYGEEEISSLVQNLSSLYQKFGKMTLKLIQALPIEQHDVLFGNSDVTDRQVE